MHFYDGNLQVRCDCFEKPAKMPDVQYSGRFKLVTSCFYESCKSVPVTAPVQNYLPYPTSHRDSKATKYWCVAAQMMWNFRFLQCFALSSWACTDPFAALWSLKWFVSRACLCCLGEKNWDMEVFVQGILSLESGIHFEGILKRQRQHTLCSRLAWPVSRSSFSL